MQISLENTGTFERKLTVTLPSSRLEEAVKSRLQNLSREVRLKGFRPGKVPMSVVEKRFGAQVREEAYGELVRQTLGEAIREQNVRPAMAPRVTPIGDVAGGELAYTAEFEVMPELDRIDVSGLDIARIESSVEDADIDQMIETLRQQRRTWTPVERGALAGDMVMFEHSATTADARIPAEGAERAGTILGSGAMLDDFEAELVGLSAGQEKTFSVTFPPNWRNPALAGKKAEVAAKIVRVQESKLPDIDDAFIRSFGIADGDMAHFRKDVRANLERELGNALAGRLKNEVVGKLLEQHASLEVPKGMVEAEAQSLHRDAQRQYEQNAGRNLPPVPPVEAFTDTATRRVRAAVLIGSLAQQNDIRIDERRVREALAAIAATYEQPDQVIELYYGNPQLMSGLQQRVLEDQVAEWVAGQSQATPRQVKFAEVMRPQQG
jgi:trigger factor